MPWPFPPLSPVGAPRRGAVVAALGLALALAGCAPPVEGASCLAHENCPDTQLCANTCRCATGTRTGASLCPGLEQTAAVAVPVAASAALVQALADGTGFSVWLPTGSEGTPEAHQYRLTGGAWQRASSLGCAATSSLSPVGLDAHSGHLAIRGDQWVEDQDFTATVYTVVWDQPARGVALANGQMVASFDTGVFQKAVGSSSSLAGQQLDAEPAEQLQISADGTVVAGLFGGEARWFVDGQQRGALGGMRRLALSADGATLAAVKSDTGVELIATTASTRRFLPGSGYSAVALNANGTVALAAGDGAPALFALRAGTWALVGSFPVDGAQVGAIALSEDGATAFLAEPWAAQVLVFQALH